MRNKYLFISLYHEKKQQPDDVLLFSHSERLNSDETNTSNLRHAHISVFLLFFDTQRFILETHGNKSKC